MKEKSAKTLGITRFLTLFEKLLKSSMETAGVEPTVSERVVISTLAGVIDIIDYVFDLITL